MRRIPHPSQSRPRPGGLSVPVVVAAAVVWVCTLAPAELLAAAAEEHGVRDTIARLLNFGILVGALTYFLKSPFAAYLASRSTEIRQALQTAAELRQAAAAQLADIERRMKALPGELEALKAQGAEDVRAEKARIARAAGQERERLLEQMRREIDMRLRVARRELFELAAQLSVSAARERITRNITPEDQLRLIDRYTAQITEAR